MQYNCTHLDLSCCGMAELKTQACDHIDFYHHFNYTTIQRSEIYRLWRKCSNSLVTETFWRKLKFKFYFQLLSCSPPIPTLILLVAAPIIQDSLNDRHQNKQWQGCDEVHSTTKAVRSSAQLSQMEENSSSSASKVTGYGCLGI